MPRPSVYAGPMAMHGSSGCCTAALAAALVLVGARASAQALDHLFKRNEEGYRCLRIPAPSRPSDP